MFFISAIIFSSLFPSFSSFNFADIHPLFNAIWFHYKIALFIHTLKTRNGAFLGAGLNFEFKYATQIGSCCYLDFA